MAGSSSGIGIFQAPHQNPQQIVGGGVVSLPMQRQQMFEKLTPSSQGTFGFAPQNISGFNATSNNFFMIKKVNRNFNYIKIVCYFI
jgi:hypothetical protein